MTSTDIRDVLNLDAHSGPRPAKKQKTNAPRPNLKGLAREVQNLGGDNPIAIVPQTTVFKKKRLANRKPPAKWELRPFQNSARGDDGSLVLKHWRRKTEVAGDGRSTPGHAENKDDEAKQREDAQPALEDSTFAKYNAQVNVPQYNDDQYASHLENSDWTKDETDYLMGLIRDYDQRWPIIWDRYIDYVPEAINGEASADGDESKAIIPAPKARTMEDLKARYYEIAAKMMAAQTPTQYMTTDEQTLYETMVGFNPAQEKMRKDFAVNALSRTKEEANEEESLLVEIKRILQRSSTFNEERRELYNRLDYPHTDQDISAFKTSTGLQTLLQNMMTIDKNKKRKSLMGSDGVSPSQQGQQQQQQSAAESSARRESVTAAAAAPPSTSGHRNSTSSVAQTPTADKEKTGGKKGAQASQERRKLSEAEKYVYGVTYHDRLQSGPTFRYERVNKLFTSKSGQQQSRIMNVLNELDMPGRLVMPTAAVTAQFEQLLGAVNSLIDARKVTDKVDAEIKLEEAKKAERQEREGPRASVGGTQSTERAEARLAEGEDGDKSAAQELKDPANEANGEDGTARGGEASASSIEPSDVKDRETEDSQGRPGSSGGGGPHKRSASVLSAVSDKSAKRQKK